MQANAQREGSQVRNVLERHRQSVLQAPGVDAEGQPRATPVAQAASSAAAGLSAERLEQAWGAICQALQVRGFSPAQLATVRIQAAGAIYEDPAQSTTVAIDDIEVKKPKAHRERATAPGSESPAQQTSSPVGASGGGNHPTVANPGARLDQGQRHFTLSGTRIGQVLRFGLAVLLHNGLLGGRVQFFTAG